MIYINKMPEGNQYFYVNKQEIDWQASSQKASFVFGDDVILFLKKFNEKDGFRNRK